MYRVIRSPDYLEHHGILGMKWGKKNGPPYPLGASDHSASERKAGWRKSLDKPTKNPESKSRSKSKLKLTDRQKKAIKIGAVAVATGLVAYGGYKLYKSGAFNNASTDYALKGGNGNYLDQLLSESSDKSKSIFDRDKASHISKITGLPIKDKPDTLEKNLELSNIDRNSSLPGMCYNCGHSTISWVMNELGIKCKALPMYGDFMDSGMTPTELKRYFKGLNWNIESGKQTTMTLTRDDSSDGYKEQIANKIKEISGGENALGIWRARAGYGHYMGWKLEDGKVSFVDPQTGMANCNKWFRGMAAKVVDSGIDIARLDNLEPNEKYIRKAIG